MKTHHNSFFSFSRSLIICFFIEIICNIPALYGQILETDTLQIDSRYDKIRFTTDRFGRTSQPIDTALTDFSLYQGSFLGGEFPHRYLSNVGQAHFPLVFEYNRQNTFATGLRQYNRYGTPNDSVRYYNSPYPFSEVQYALGSGQEQFLRVDISLPIRRVVHLNAHYQSQVAVGAFERQSSSWKSFWASLNYEHPKQHYRLWLHYAINGGKNQQNGGLQALDTINGKPINLVLDTIARPKSILSPYLTNAEDNFREHRFFLQQTLDWGTYYDEVHDDTTYTRLYPERTLGHSFTYQKQQYRYSDTQPNDSFYPNFYINPDTTSDSVQYQLIENEIFAALFAKREADSSYMAATLLPFRRVFSARAGFRHQLIQAQYFAPPVADTLMLPDTTYQPLNIARWLHSGMVFGKFENLNNERLRFEAGGWYALFGYNLADFSLEGKFSFLLSGNVGGLKGRVLLQNLTPSFIANQYYGNHFMWQNDFGKTQSLQLWASYYNPTLNLELVYANHTFNNYIIWNEAAQPRQLSDVLNVSQLIVRHKFHFRHWHLDNMLIAQLPGNNTQVHLPRFVGRHTLYWQGHFFASKAVLAQIGFDIFENTRYAPDAYMPATGQFYLQSTQLPFYPIVDLFAHFKVKRLRVFLRIKHLNQGIFAQKGYFTAPNYPAFDRNFNFGIAWMFYD